MQKLVKINMIIYLRELPRSIHEIINDKKNICINHVLIPVRIRINIEKIINKGEHI